MAHFLAFLIVAVIPGLTKSADVFTNVTGFGLTACDKFDKDISTSTWQDCYAACVNDATCTTYTWHTGGNTCTLAKTPTRSKTSAGTFSGSQLPIPSAASGCNGPPGPPKPTPCPSPPPSPPAKAGTRVTLDVVIQKKQVNIRI